MDLGGPGTDTVNPLFAGLLDDAAIFPPGNLPLREAIPAHHAHRSAWYGDLVGPFVLSDTDLAGIGSEPIRISVIATAPPVVADERIVAVETRLPALARTIDKVPVYVELPWNELPVGIDALPPNARVKLRTGGTEASAFPSETALAAAIAVCVEQGRPFKCTAGLHHAIRHTDPLTGFEHHGFLNVLVASTATADPRSALAERNPDVIVKELEAAEPEVLMAARRSFVSFGTCSIADPVADLVTLGLLSTP